MSSHKSVVTCDLEGRIETFSEGAEALFGYRPEEVVGRKRVSLFSPGHVVLGHVQGWLDAATRDGKFEGRTVFVRRDGTQFAAEIRITPTFRQGRQVGYCGVTVPLEQVRPEEVMPEITLWTRIFAWLVVTRAPFLTASLLPVLFAAALVGVSSVGSFPLGLFALAVVGAIALHVAANTFNDYFDWRSGTDPENTEYFMPFSGGSRSIELGLISERGLFRVGVGALLLASLAGAVLVTVRGPGILLFGAAGAFAAYFYTAPPLRLAARKGLGELFSGLSFGPFLVAGTIYALAGEVSAGTFLAGLPIGLLTAAILWVNEFPDAPSDEKTGKRNLVVVLGRRNARWGYAALLVLAFASLPVLVAAGVLPVGVLLGLVSAPLAVRTTRIVFEHYEDRELVAASAGTIQLHLLTGALMAVGCLLGAALLPG